jgi:hypothetical protein
MTFLVCNTHAAPSVCRSPRNLHRALLPPPLPPVLFFFSLLLPRCLYPQSLSQSLAERRGGALHGINPGPSTTHQEMGTDRGRSPAVGILMLSTLSRARVLTRPLI